MMTNIRLVYFKHLVTITDKSHHQLWKRMQRWLDRRRREQDMYGYKRRSTASRRYNETIGGATGL
eukprot:4805928-Karenia_brevis.AAC.1